MIDGVWEAFPSLTMVLQGDNVMVDLVSRPVMAVFGRRHRV